MVFWCKNCGALIGLREPRTDWSTDRSRLCQSCLDKIASIAGVETNGAELASPVNGQGLVDTTRNESVPS